jgi:hypothetical protein
MWYSLSRSNIEQRINTTTCVSVIIKNIQYIQRIIYAEQRYTHQYYAEGLLQTKTTTLNEGRGILSAKDWRQEHLDDPAMSCGKGAAQATCEVRAESARIE